MTNKVMRAVGLGLVFFGIGCSFPVDGSGTPSGRGTGTGAPGQETGGDRPEGAGRGLSGVDANTQFVAENDPTRAQEIANRMWQVMTSQPCFYMKNSTSNYSFWGNLQYRYAGYETTSGTIGVNSVGAFGPYDMADVMIGSTQYWIGIGDERTLVISSIYGGSLVTNTFVAPGPGGQCV